MNILVMGHKVSHQTISGFPQNSKGIERARHNEFSSLFFKVKHVTILVCTILLLLLLSLHGYGEMSQGSSKLSNIRGWGR